MEIRHVPHVYYFKKVRILFVLLPLVAIKSNICDLFKLACITLNLVLTAGYFCWPLRAQNLPSQPWRPVKHILSVVSWKAYLKVGKILHPWEEESRVKEHKCVFIILFCLYLLRDSPPSPGRWIHAFLPSHHCHPHRHHHHHSVFWAASLMLLYFSLHQRKWQYKERLCERECVLCLYKTPWHTARWNTRCWAESTESHLLQVCTGVHTGKKQTPGGKTTWMHVIHNPVGT